MKALSIAVLDLCHEIEKLPASEQQTTVSLKASDLRYRILFLEKKVLEVSQSAGLQPE